MKSVLIVEDEIFIAMEIERILEEAGYSVIAIAADRQEALRAGDKADLALIDLNLRDGPTGPMEEVPGIAEGGRLYIRGPNVMAGYFLASDPGKLQPPHEGWHDTGDIVTIDDAGFIAIRGRAKRFAKIGGEMVSLPAVEGYAAKCWPGFDHAIVTRPDPKKGEQLVLFTTAPGAEHKALQAWAKANGVTELMIPRDIRVVNALPVLGTGKLDYVTMGEIAVQVATREAVQARELDSTDKG